MSSNGRYDAGQLRRRMRRGRAAVALCVLLGVVLSAPATEASAHPPRRARAAIVSGSPISVEQAPWQVAVTTTIPISHAEAEVIHCSGSILDETEILTAAHCLFSPTSGARVPADLVTVQAGTSDFREREKEEQSGSVSGIRVHPYYSYAGRSEGDPDDIAVLTLSKPLTFAATVKPIAPIAAGSLFVEAASVNLTGFGQEAPGEGPSGQLHSLGMSLAFAPRCAGEANAVVLCASASSGAVCHGDSGSALTLPGSPAMLIGVVDVNLSSGEGSCADGTLAGFADVAAPEIRDFIAGSESPPQAPRGGGASIEGIPLPGNSLTCQPGSWSHSPTFTYTFVDSASGAVLQSGSSSTYPLALADVGRRIICEVGASNTGGTGIDRTPGLGPIGPPASGAVLAAGPIALSTALLAAIKVTVQGRGLALVRLRCLGSATCHGKLTLMARRTVEVRGSRKLRMVSIGAIAFTIPGGQTRTVDVRLLASGRALLSADHGELKARLAILGIDTNPLHPRVEYIRLVREKTRSKR